MFCPHCGHNDSKVIDSRDAGEGIRRRRECLSCTTRFTTYERAQAAAWLVVKRDGRREEFSHDKLFNSVRLACAKRPLPTGAIERIVSDVETQVQRLGRAETPSSSVGELVMDRLKTLDRVAYIRYASVYRDFADLETFMDELEHMLSGREVSRGIPENQPPLFALEQSITIPQIRKRGRPKKIER